MHFSLSMLECCVKLDRVLVEPEKSDQSADTGLCSPVIAVVLPVLIAPSHQLLAFILKHKIWASTRDNLSSGFANNTGAGQPAHLRSLISTFVIHVFESTISKLATSQISFF